MSAPVTPIKKGQCFYLLGDGKLTPFVYCGKPCRYVMTRDDDRRPVRKYDAFCPEHRQIVDREDADE